MQLLPPALTDLIDAFGQLPGVGPRTAERYAYGLLKQTSSNTPEKLAEALQGLKQGVAQCTKTYALIPAGETVSSLYSDPERDKQVVCVVAEPFDLIAIEKTGKYTGTYHVLGGLVSPIDGVTPEQLHISELAARIKKDKVKELILATNASVEGESTALYIQQQLTSPKLKISRLARGLSVGVDLEYADQISLGRALDNRQAV